MSGSVTELSSESGPGPCAYTGPAASAQTASAAAPSIRRADTACGTRDARAGRFENSFTKDKFMEIRSMFRTIVTRSLQYAHNHSRKLQTS
ncbi:hypothetical protein BN2475_100026 [Paraburkholderia ribeironis]|uniref:Uncharacterized protein n=1 Tax=Paraburkholderia ribeironis TaxID=1247936 RepID=A0A1N7RP85_9BURK|nr:hypothetical protein BN2475_100026 [Paraburkholderia ribeironis]